MSKASQLIETHAFTERLRLALKGVGIWPSPTVVANEFNLRYWGKSITSQTARNWLLGKSIPMQDREMLARYLTLSLADRKTVCDVVAALAVAATVKTRGSEKNGV